MPFFGFGQRSSISVRRPSISKKPAPKTPPKPAEKPKGLFGEKNQYRTFRDMKQFARKAPPKRVPNFGGRLYKSEREKAIKRLQGYARKYLRRSYGMSPRDLGNIKDESSILGRLSKEVSAAKRRGQWDRAKQLKKDIEIYKQWKKGF